MLMLAIAALAGPLAPLEYWVGHCWISGVGTPLIDRHCFTAIDGGTRVRDAHEVTLDGKVLATGETIYSARDGRLALTYANSVKISGDGFVEAGTELRFTLYLRESGGVRRSEVVWRRTPEGYDVINSGNVRKFRRDDR